MREAPPGGGLAPAPGERERLSPGTGFATVRRMGSRPGPMALWLVAALAANVAGAAPADELRVARDLLHGQRFADALKTVGGVLKEEPDSFEANYLAGQIYEEARKPAQALDFYVKATRVDPLHAECAGRVVELVRGSLGSGGESAQATLEALVKQGVLLPPLLVELQRIYAASQERTRSIKVASMLAERLTLEQVPRTWSKASAEVLVAGARAAYASGNLAKTSELTDLARNTFGGAEGLVELQKQVRTDLEEKARPAKERADAAAAKGDWERAVKEYKAALDQAPHWQDPKQRIQEVAALQESETLVAEASALEKKGDAVASVAKLQMALEHLPEGGFLAGAAEKLKETIEAKKAAFESQAAEQARRAREKQAAFAAAYDRGEAAMTAKRYIEAAAAFREAVGFFPDDGRAKAQLAEAERLAEIQRGFEEGVAAIKKGDFAKARQTLEKVQEKDPGIPGLKRYLAVAYFEGKNLDAARQAAETALQASPRDTEMLYMLGVIHHQRFRDDKEKPDRAISYLERIEQDQPDYKDVADRLKDLRWQQNRAPVLFFMVAGVLWVAGMFWNKNRPQILKNRFLGALEKAAAKERWADVAALEGEARSYPLDRAQDLAVATALAQAFYHKKDWPKAINWCSAALALAREKPELMTLMGRIYFESRTISQEVLKYLVGLSNQEPDNFELMRFIGEFCLERQIINDETMPLLRNLAMAMPQHDKLRRMLIRGHLRNQDRGARALALYRVELEKDPNNVDLRYYVAEDCLKAGKVEDCIRHCELILNEKLNHVPTHEVLRAAYGKLGKLDELARTYQAILERDPYNPAVQDSLKKLMDPKAAAPKVGGEAGGGPKKCAKCGNPVQVGQYYCTCGAPL